VTSQDRGRLRAARTDREQAIELLKAAFVQGRLTKDEFDARVGQTLASRTYAELAVPTADIPADLTVAVPRRKPGRAPKQATALSTGLVAAAVLLMSAVLIGNTQLTYLAVTVVCGAAFVTVAQILHSRHERLSRALPPRSAPAGRSLGC
jgi:hypothetical protein